MSEFCKQCSTELFGKDFEDLAKLNNHPLEKGTGIGVICEGCGFTVVNEEGECIADNCEKHGKGLIDVEVE